MEIAQKSDANGSVEDFVQFTHRTTNVSTVHVIVSLPTHRLVCMIYLPISKLHHHTVETDEICDMLIPNVIIG